MLRKIRIQAAEVSSMLETNPYSSQPSTQDLRNGRLCKRLDRLANTNIIANCKTKFEARSQETARCLHDCPDDS